MPLTEDEIRRVAADLMLARDSIRAAAIVVGSAALDLAAAMRAEAERAKAAPKRRRRRKKPKTFPT